MNSIFRTALIVSFFFLVATPQVIAQQSTGPSLVAEQYISLMARGYFEQASNLFHYPNSYTTEEKRSEFNSLKTDLQKYAETFGNIIETSNSMPEGNYIGIGVSGAGIDYWADYAGEIKQIMLPSNFQYVGWGVLRIGLISTDSKWEIQQVDYGFIRTDESIKAIRTLSEI